MDSKSLTGTVVGLAVVVILTATLLMPVLSDATQTTETFTNEGVLYLEKYDTAAELTIVWDYTDPEVVTVGTEEIALATDTAYPLTVCGDSVFFARYFLLDNVYYFQLYSNGASADLNANTSDEVSATITISGGTVTATDGTNTKSYTYEDFIFVASPDGEYVMKSSTDTAYVLGDSVVYGIGRSSMSYYTGNQTTNFYLEGSISDGITVTPISYTSVTTVNDVTVSATEVDDYVNLYELSSVTFTATHSNYGPYGSATYSQIIVPVEVTAELAQHLDSGQIALVNAIPIIIIVSIVLASVGIVEIGRRD